MKKSKEIRKTTTDNRVYRAALNDEISGCPICSPNRGCNRNRDYDTSWKNFRKTQYKEQVK